MASLHPLSERDVAILAFEHRFGQHSGAKDEAIRDQFGLSAVRYYQVLNLLIDSAAALAHDPMLVRRLVRARDTRAEARAARAGRARSVGQTAFPGRRRDG